MRCLYSVTLATIALGILWNARAGERLNSQHSDEHFPCGQVDVRPRLSGEKAMGGQLRSLLAWHEWCEQEGRRDKSKPPLCAMYFVRTFDEPMAETLPGWDVAIDRENVPSGGGCKESQSKWKRVELIIAIWGDGRVLRSSRLRGSGNSSDAEMIDKRHISSFVESLERLELARQPLPRMRYTYVDVAYWVIEIGLDDQGTHMATWNLRPDPAGRDAEFVRFCTVWKCAFAWLEQFANGRSRAAQESTPVSWMRVSLAGGRGTS
jgi:hypothetical protein